MQTKITIENIRREILQVNDLIEVSFATTADRTAEIKTNLSELKEQTEKLNWESDWLMEKLKHIRFIYEEKFALNCIFDLSQLKQTLGRKLELVIRILIEETLNSIAGIKQNIDIKVIIRNPSESHQLIINSEGFAEEFKQLESVHLAESRVNKVCQLFNVEPSISYQLSEGNILFAFKIHEV